MIGVLSYGKEWDNPLRGFHGLYIIAVLYAKSLRMGGHGKRTDKAV